MGIVIALMPTDGIVHPHLEHIEEQLDRLRRVDGVPLSVAEKRLVLDIVRPLFEIAGTRAPNPVEVAWLATQKDVRKYLRRRRYMILHFWIRPRVWSSYDVRLGAASFDDLLRACLVTAAKIITPEGIDALR